MSGFFLNQKSSFFAFFFFKSQQNQDLLSKGGNQTRSLVHLPCGRCGLASPAGSPATLACAFHTFWCRLFSGGCLAGCSCPALYHFAFTVTELSGRPSLVADRSSVWWSLPPDSAVQASHSLPGISKGLFAEVVRGDHLYPETLTQRMRLEPEIFYITDLPGKPDDFSCLLGLGCAHVCQGKLGGCCHAEVLPHSCPLQELLRTPSDNTGQRKT